MNILFFGDVVGNRGIASISSYLGKIKERYNASFCIVNGENAASGFGLRYSDYRMLRDAGADCVTLGNHYNDHGFLEGYIEDTHALVRPCNVRDFDYGFGSVVFDCGSVLIRVTNILGTAFMKEEVNSPMVALTDILNNEEKIALHIVDYHAESTSEKGTFAYLFDGKVSAIIGTHTHIQTNDARILPKGTAFITDVGMCGNLESVIGYEPTSVINRIIYNGPTGVRIGTEGPLMINAVLLDVDESIGKVRAIKPLYYIDGEERIYG